MIAETDFEIFFLFNLTGLGHELTTRNGSGINKELVALVNLSDGVFELIVQFGEWSMEFLL